ncbi:MAG: hypothetical protein JSS35_14495, partial [Proteobacteria bacterium]|nr:hypothetical protein [Pseudomonadota bacterium]
MKPQGAPHLERRALLTAAAFGLSGGLATAAVPENGASRRVEWISLWPPGKIEAPPAGVTERMIGNGLTGVTAPRLEVMRPPPSANLRRAILLVPGG